MDNVFVQVYESTDFRSRGLLCAWIKCISFSFPSFVEIELRCIKFTHWRCIIQSCSVVLENLHKFVGISSHTWFARHQLLLVYFPIRACLISIVSMMWFVQRLSHSTVLSGFIHELCCSAYLIPFSSFQGKISWYRLGWPQQRSPASVLKACAFFVEL